MQLQIGMKKMKEGIQRQASMGGGGGGNISSGAVNDKFALLKKDLESLQDNQVQAKAAVLLKLSESEKKNRELTDESIHRYGHKLQTGIMKFISDLKTGHNETSTKLDAVEKVAWRLRDLHAEKALSEGNYFVNRVMEKWVLSSCRKAFIKWRDMDLHGTRPVGQKLQGFLVKVWLRFTTYYGFHKWKDKIAAINRRGVLRIHLRNILAKWKRISFRDIKVYFVLWKRNSLYSSYLSREAQLRKDRSVVAREPLTQVGDMIRRMGDDTDGKLLVLGTIGVLI